MDRATLCFYLLYTQPSLSFIINITFQENIIIHTASSRKPTTRIRSLTSVLETHFLRNNLRWKMKQTFFPLLGRKNGFSTFPSILGVYPEFSFSQNCHLNEAEMIRKELNVSAGGLDIKAFPGDFQYIFEHIWLSFQILERFEFLFITE